MLPKNNQFCSCTSTKSLWQTTLMKWFLFQSDCPTPASDWLPARYPLELQGTDQPAGTDCSHKGCGRRLSFNFRVMKLLLKSCSIRSISPSLLCLFCMKVPLFRHFGSNVHFLHHKLLHVHSFEEPACQWMHVTHLFKMQMSCNSIFCHLKPFVCVQLPVFIIL